jgi:hypothetical protein
MREHEPHYEAATTLLRRMTRWSSIKSWMFGLPGATEAKRRAWRSRRKLAIFFSHDVEGEHTAPLDICRPRRSIDGGIPLAEAEVAL